MHVERSKFSGIVLSLLGKRLRGLRLEGGGVMIVGPQQRLLSFAEIAAPAEIGNGFPFFSISLSVTDGCVLKDTIFFDSMYAEVRPIPYG